MHFVMTFGTVVNGWSSTAAYPSFGDDYWFRATANFGGIWWNSSNEAVYEMLHADAAGNTPTGDTTYTMRFEPGRTPDTVADELLVAHHLRQARLHARPEPDQPLQRQLPLRARHRRRRLAHLYLAPELPAGSPSPTGSPHPPARRSPPTCACTSRDQVRTGAWVPPALVPVDQGPVP